MKKKQIVIALVILVLGMLIGKFALGNSSATKVEEHVSETKKVRWTCSMHPEIDLPEFGPCPKCGMDLIPKEDNSEGLSSSEFKMSENAMALANIETLEIGVKNDTKNEKDTNENLLSLSGKIMANEKATSVQTAHFGGRIEKLKYRSIGEYIKKGSLIATVYSPELVTAQNEFVEALSIKNAQPELYKAVRNKLKNWKISENQIQQIEQTKKAITNFNMYANVSGYIDEVLVQEGNHLKEGSPLFRVSNLGTVWAMFDVYEQDIKNIKIGQQITIKSNAYPNEEIKASINYIDPNLDVNTRTVQIRTTLKNSGTKLKPGMLLVAKVLVKNKNLSGKTNIISVPKTAIMWTGKRSIVYVKTSKDEPIFELREVTLGNPLGNNYQVLSGLENGEEIVINGTFTVDATAQLQGKSSMMNQKMKNEKLKVKNVERIVVNPKFKKQLHVVFQDYIAIKDAFVLTDAKQVNEKAAQTL
ncbi:MAG: efflux RND transporter periplasmic adaptor subunit, partial [Flavobacteriaceae bacterium]|nr:efflux RND transporter periplasmic adaptor subunit [Flavobacteriaceae bacterium]